MILLLLLLIILNGWIRDARLLYSSVAVFLIFIQLNTAPSTPSPVSKLRQVQTTPDGEIYSNIVSGKENGDLYIRPSKNYPVPVGTIAMTLTETIPDGWALCDGSEIPNDPTNATEYAKYQDIRLFVGSSDGKYNYPDLSGFTPYGADSSNSINTVLGYYDVPVTEANLPSHRHSIEVSTNNTDNAVRKSTYWDLRTIQRGSDRNADRVAGFSNDSTLQYDENTYKYFNFNERTLPTGEDNASIFNVQPSVIVNFIIKI